MSHSVLKAFRSAATCVANPCPYNFVHYAVPFGSLFALIKGILAQTTHKGNENATKQKACVRVRNKSLCISVPLQNGNVKFFKLCTFWRERGRRQLIFIIFIWN